MEIDGYTDNSGKPEKNQVLSENRANSVADYFKTKGIIEESRLVSKGFGKDKPIADNKKAAVRAKNRRVEMRAKNY